ncbi:MAG TPA: hypothetical protein PL110_19100, partial [Candidatus Eremiobacteraeota bacterium]|nr:hypothetical protein [Candidatus Eremiobacteraeota bacterium]
EKEEEEEEEESFDDLSIDEEEEEEEEKEDLIVDMVEKPSIDERERKEDIGIIDKPPAKLEIAVPLESLELPGQEFLLNELGSLLNRSFLDLKESINEVNDNLTRQMSHHYTQSSAYMEEVVSKLSRELLKGIASTTSASPELSDLLAVSMEEHMNKISELINSREQVKTTSFQDTDIYKELLKEHQNALLEIERLQNRILSLEQELEEVKVKSLELKRLLKEKSEYVVEISSDMEKMKITGGTSKREDELAKELDNKNKLMEKLVSNVKSLVEEKKELSKEKERIEKDIIKDREKLEKEKLETEETKKILERKLKESANKLSSKLSEIDKTELKAREWEKKVGDLQRRFDAAERENKT